MPISLDNIMGIHAKALSVRAKRAEMIANNLANADTPNYKAKDLDFRELLSNANNNMSGNLKATHSKHIGFNQNDLNMNTMYRIPSQPKLDGNTVDTQLETGAFTENSVRYSASLQFLGGRIQAIKSALKGD